MNCNCPIYEGEQHHCMDCSVEGGEEEWIYATKVEHILERPIKDLAAAIEELTKVIRSNNGRY